MSQHSHNPLITSQPQLARLAHHLLLSRDGGVVSYPIVETIHKNNICHVTEAPAGVPPAVQAQARAVAEKAIACLSGAGIFGCVAACMFHVCLGV